MNASTMNDQPITLLVCALGGEGGGVLADWLVDVARRAGHAAQSTSIPGVAQRTGATTYYLEFAPQPMAVSGPAAGRRPVFSLYPVPGQVDLLVSSELLETARQVSLGVTSAERSVVLSSSARALTTAERMVPGDGRLDAARLAEVIRQGAREHQLIDMAALTQSAGTVVSAVMLGAVAASGVLPFDRALYEAAIGSEGKAAAASRRGFAAAFEQVQRQRAQGEALRGVIAAAPAQASPALALPEAAAHRFPAALHPVLALGHARLVEYQDAGYAALYLERLQRVLDAERAADPHAAQSFALTREAARWLALWMAFDDLVRVAERKLSDARLAGIRREARAAEGDVVRVWDHFKPGVPEIAGLLPAGLAGALQRWDRRRSQRGLAPWSKALRLGTHSLRGALALRLLVALKPLRRQGLRWAEEQALIERWLDAVVTATGRDWAVGHELALCARLIKGYGGTHERGRTTLGHIVGELAQRVAFPSEAARAAAIAQARQLATRTTAQAPA
ncbi:MAG TPA: indolepyruvate oxidoreductase subunit beta family protein, partial [Burkholderiaceae bacterium]|nr:indolepyruvate oxidoreductase subunit beta family protein [Burkholderiaceae bacterium]